MGRNTYDAVLGFGQWPYGCKRVVVLNGRPIKIPHDLTRTVEWRSCSPAALVDELSDSGVDHLYIDGGKTIQSFLNGGLIQEIIITEIPILIGSGIPLFGPLSTDTHLAHIETRSFENDFVQSKYRVTDLPDQTDP
jgi:dihydrofolate reductase